MYIKPQLVINRLIIFDIIFIYSNKGGRGTTSKKNSPQKNGEGGKYLYLYPPY